MFDLKSIGDQLEFRPISELPGFPDQSLDREEDEYWDQRIAFGLQVGMVLRGKFGYTLIGNDSCGGRTAGCSCCSDSWVDMLTNEDNGYTGWAWLEL